MTSDDAVETTADAVETTAKALHDWAAAQHAGDLEEFLSDDQVRDAARAVVAALLSQGKPQHGWVWRAGGIVTPARSAEDAKENVEQRQQLYGEDLDEAHAVQRLSVILHDDWGTT